MAIIKKSKQMLSKTWRQENLYSLLVSVQSYTTTLEIISEACPNNPKVRAMA